MSGQAIGVTGVDSIRLNGTKVSELPMAERAMVSASGQLALAYDDERKNQIEAVLATYPKQSVDYVNSRIRRAEENIDRINRERGTIAQRQSTYINLKTLASMRDEELELCADEEAQASCNLKWNKALLGKSDTNIKHKVFETEKLEEQIKLDNDSIERMDGALAQEHKDIANMRELIGTLLRRDQELKKLGVRVG